jgi:hypothetical protein
VPPPVPSSPPPTLGVPEQYETTRGYTAEPPAGPVIETLPPAPPVTAEDLTMQSNRDNNRMQAGRRYRDNPSLQDPSRLAGTSVPGVGTWGYPDQPREPGAGAAYQEQLHGVPYGLEMNVGGRIDAAGNISGGAWLDGYQVRAGQVVLIDRKDWSKSFAEFASRPEFQGEKVLEEARRQANAASGSGARIEWQFSNEDAAKSVRRVLDNAGLENIRVVVVPKKH